LNVPADRFSAVKDKGMEAGSRRRLVDYLPAIYRRSEQLEDFLWAFETILFRTLGDEESGPRSLEQRIDEIPSLFDPDPKKTPENPHHRKTPEEFLPWLAQWAALTLYQGTPEGRGRRLIAEMIPLYRKRGTREYVEEVLRLYTGVEAVVEEEDLPGIEVGVRSTVGRDTRLGEDPFRFRVKMNFFPIPPSREERLRLIALVHAVVNLAKPAHTHYQLSHNLAEEKLGLVILVRSTVGIDTLLWSEQSDDQL
jgi:phage tail-like protein